MPFIVSDINDTEKPGLFVGRIVRPDSGNVLDYQTVAQSEDAKENEKIREKFKKDLDAKAAKYKARIEQSERSGVTPESKGNG